MAHGGVHVHPAGPGGRGRHRQQTVRRGRVSDQKHSADLGMVQLISHSNMAARDTNLKGKK